MKWLQFICKGISSICEIRCIVFVGVFQQYIMHLELFKIPPEARRNSSRTFLNRFAIMQDAPPMRRVSSAKREWFISLTPLDIWIPNIFSLFYDFPA